MSHEPISHELVLSLTYGQCQEIITETTAYYAFLAKATVTHNATHLVVKNVDEQAVERLLSEGHAHCGSPGFWTGASIILPGIMITFKTLPHAKWTE
jgi:hypothetical protein